MSETYVYIGSWVSPRQAEGVRGITTAKYDPQTGKLTALRHEFDDVNVSMLTYDEKNSVLYTSNERPETEQGLGGQALAFKVNRKTGELTEISRVSSYGKMPSFVAFDPERKYLVLTNHAHGTFITKTVQDENGQYHLVKEYEETASVLYRLNPDGSIGEVCDIVKHTGHGARPEQTHPHMHSARFTPDGKYVFICDKGNDGYYCYHLDREKEKLVLVSRLASFPGASPRYSAMDAAHHRIYFNNETMPVITAVTYDGNGQMTMTGNYDALDRQEWPQDKPAGMQSDLLLSADGKHLYDNLRQQSRTVVFEVNQDDGSLTKVQEVAGEGTGGGRAMAFSPDGQYLYLCAGPDTPHVYGYRVEEDGTLTSIGSALQDYAPGGIAFAQGE